MAKLARFGLIIVLGIAIARLMLQNESMRRLLHCPTHPVLLGDSARYYITSQSTTLVPNGEPSATPVKFSHRVSWRMLDKDRPSAAGADPTIGRTTIEYLDPDLEMKLSSAFQDAKFVLPVLRVGVLTEGGHSVAGVEFWCGKPPSRVAIEQEAVRIVSIAFQTVGQLDEVDLESIPWRTYHGFRPPGYFSVAARRVDYLAATEHLAARQILDRYGAVWWDPRVMSDFPVPTAPPQHSAKSPSPAPRLSSRP